MPRADVAPRDAQTVPRLLQQLAAWSWRLLLVGLLIYVAFRLASALRLVVLPCFAAMLLTALLQPLTARLRRAWPALAGRDLVHDPGRHRGPGRSRHARGQPGQRRLPAAVG